MSSAVRMVEMAGAVDPFSCDFDAVVMTVSFKRSCRSDVSSARAVVAIVAKAATAASQRRILRAALIRTPS